MFKYFPRILRGRRKNEEYAERIILGWKGLVPLIEIGSKNRIQGINMDINRTIFNFNFFYIKKKLLSAYTETALNGDFSPKSAIISKKTNKEKFFF